MDGILVVDKPVGFTSHDVIAKTRGILRTKKVGHTGTLDPFATGVLVLLIGKATRLAQFFDKDAKEYEATVKFGYETDSGDVTGTPKSEQTLPDEEIAVALSKTDLEEIFSKFHGEIQQTPPMYSAKKVDGKKLYELARKGVEIERKPINITIFELELLEKTACEIRLRVLCSAGTYIRTLAEDIGKAVGIGAHLTELRRTKVGVLSIQTAVTLDILSEIAREAKVPEILIAMNDATAHLPKFDLSEADFKRVSHGLSMRTREIFGAQPIRLVDAENNLAGIGEFCAETSVIKPRLVMI